MPRRKVLNVGGDNPKRPRPWSQRNELSLGVALGFVALTLALLWWPVHAPWSWAALAICVTALSVVARGLAQAKRFEPAQRWFVDHGGLALEAAALVFLLGFYAWLVGDATLGSRPVDHDHTIHYYKAWETHQLLGQGKLRAWSDGLFVGYPANYLYPPGASLFVNLVHALGLGMVSFSHAYGLAIYLLMVLSGHAVFRLTRVFVGSRAAFFAAVLFALDVGAFRYGGFVNTLKWGVWPQALGTMLACYGLAELPTIFERRSWAAVGRFALLAGFAVVSHPASVLMLGLCVPASAVGIAAMPRGDRRAAMGRLAVGGGLALLVAGLYLFPLLDSKAFALKLGRDWRDTSKMAEAVFEGRLLRGTGWFVHALAGLGAYRLLRRSGWRGAYVVVCALALIALGTTDVLAELGAWGRQVYASVNAQRISILVKPFFLAAAGAGLAHAMTLGRGPAEARASDRTTDASAGPTAARWLRPTILAVAVALAAPFGLPWLERMKITYEGLKLTPIERRLWRDELAQVVEYAKARPSDPVARWMFDYGKSYLFIDVAAQIDAPVYKYEFTPASIYRYKVQDRGEAAMRIANVRYVVALEDRASPPGLRLLERFGQLRVYEYEHWRPQPFTVIEGAGEVELESYAPEEIVLRAAPGSDGVLQLHVSDFSRWEATVDGQPLPIERSSVKDVRFTGLVTVPLRPGEYRFRFVRHAVEYASSALAILAAFLALWLAVFRRHPARASTTLDDPSSASRTSETKA